MERQQQIHRPRVQRRAEPASVQRREEGIPNSGMAGLLAENDRHDPGLLEAMSERIRQLMDSQIPSAEREADELAKGASGTSAAEIKASLGAKMGADFSGVRFHTGPDAVAKAEAMGARAYTTGLDVFFGEGGFAPDVAAHELVHTAQQGVVESTVATESVAMGTVQMEPSDDKEQKGEKTPPPTPSPSHALLTSSPPAPQDKTITFVHDPEKRLLKRQENHNGKIVSGVYIGIDGISRKMEVPLTLEGPSITVPETSIIKLEKCVERFNESVELAGLKAYIKDLISKLMSIPDGIAKRIDALTAENDPLLQTPLLRTYYDISKRINALTFEAVKKTGMGSDYENAPARTYWDGPNLKIKINKDYPDYYLGPNGELDEQKLYSTMVHEAFHYSSFNGTGFQNISTTFSLKDSPDEAMTDYLAVEAYRELFQNHQALYKTGYWPMETKYHPAFSEAHKALYDLHDKGFLPTLWTGDLVHILTMTLSAHCEEKPEEMLRSLKTWYFTDPSKLDVLLRGYTGRTSMQLGKRIQNLWFDAKKERLRKTDWYGDYNEWLESRKTPSSAPPSAAAAAAADAAPVAASAAAAPANEKKKRL